MRPDLRFPRQVLVTLAAGIVLAAYPAGRFASREVIIAAAAGAALSTVNVLAGYVAITYAIDKSYTTFLKVVLGGMGVRMLFLAGAMLVLIVVCKLDAVALTVTLLVFYTMYLVLEVLYIQRQLAVRDRGAIDG